MSFRGSRPNIKLRAKLFAVGATAVVSLVGAQSLSAAILTTSDPGYPTGAPVFTLDTDMHSEAGRTLTADRELRQTFQNSTTFTVGEIVVSLDVQGGGQNGGLVVDIYEVDDVNAASFVPLGGPIHTITIPTSDTIAATADTLGITLTDADQFVLPQRNTGTQGYAFEISNVDGTTQVGSIRHSNAGTDDFTGGRFYDESGGAPGSGLRDIGLAIAPTPIPEPGTCLLASLAVAVFGGRRSFARR